MTDYPEAFSAEGAITKATKRHEDKEVTSWRPSRIGACRTGLYLERLGVKPDTEFDARTLRVFETGKIFERWISDLLKQEARTYQEQVRLEWPEQDVTGYADALVNDMLVYEYKTKHSKSFWYMKDKGEGPSLHNQMQLWLALKILDKPEGRLCYISKDDLSILEYIVFLKNESLEKATMEELRVLNLAWKEKVAPRPIKDPKDWRNRYCRWHQGCLSQSEYLD